MSDPRIANLARLLVNYCVETKPGQRVVIQGNAVALPLMRETYRAVLHAGAHPLTWITDEDAGEILHHIGLVVDDENACGAHAAPPWTGRVRTKVVPSPGRDCTSMVP